MRGQREFVVNLLQVNLAYKAQSMSQHDCLTRITGILIDEEIVVAMEYRQIIKISKHIPVWFKYFVNGIG